MEIPNDAKAEIQNLKKQIAEERQYRIEVEVRQAWLSELDDQIRTHLGSDVNTFSQALLHSIARKVEVLIGGMYVVQAEEELHFTAGYGITLDNVDQASFAMGEGMIGQVAMSKEPKFIDLSGSQEVTFKTASVNIHPSQLVLFPITYNNETKGVLELYLVHKLGTEHQEMLQEASTRLAMALDAIVKQTQIQKMLQASQEMVEEKAAQEEEIRQNMEELQSTQEEMGRVQQEMDNMMDGIDRSMALISFDTEGYITHANNEFQELYGLTYQELMGQHHNSVVDPEYAKSAEYEQFWAELRNGNFQRGEFKRFGKNGREIWIMASYNPIFNTHGEVYKIVKLAIDITEQKEQQKRLMTMTELEEAYEEIKSQETEIQRLLEVTRVNEQQMQESEKKYRDYIKDISKQLKQLQAENTELRSNLQEVA